MVTFTYVVGLSNHSSVCVVDAVSCYRILIRVGWDICVRVRACARACMGVLAWVYRVYLCDSCIFVLLYVCVGLYLSGSLSMRMR